MKYEVWNGRILVTLKDEASDGHKRIATGPGFIIAGGSEGSHARMVETIVKVAADLGERGLTLESADPHLLAETIVRHYKA
jgi:hypothetical protein